MLPWEIVLTKFSVFDLWLLETTFDLHHNNVNIINDDIPLVFPPCKCTTGTIHRTFNHIFLIPSWNNDQLIVVESQGNLSNVQDTEMTDSEIEREKMKIEREEIEKQAADVPRFVRGLMLIIGVHDLSNRRIYSLSNEGGKPLGFLQWLLSTLTKICLSIPYTESTLKLLFAVTFLNWIIRLRTRLLKLSALTDRDMLRFHCS